MQLSLGPRDEWQVQLYVPILVVWHPAGRTDHKRKRKEKENLEKLKETSDYWNAAVTWCQNWMTGSALRTDTGSLTSSREDRSQKKKEGKGEIGKIEGNYSDYWNAAVTWSQKWMTCSALRTNTGSLTSSREDWSKRKRKKERKRSCEKSGARINLKWVGRADCTDFHLNESVCVQHGKSWQNWKIQEKPSDKSKILDSPAQRMFGNKRLFETEVDSHRTALRPW